MWLAGSETDTAVTKQIFGFDEVQRGQSREVHLNDVEDALARATTLMMWSAAVDNGTLSTYTTQVCVRAFEPRTVYDLLSGPLLETLRDYNVRYGRCYCE